MFSKKKTECRVCGYRFTPERENIYTAEEPRSALEMLTTAPTRWKPRQAGFKVSKPFAQRTRSSICGAGS